MDQKIHEIAERLYMLPLPMPFRLKHVNVFAALEEEGFTLIDVGPNLPGTLPALSAGLAEIGRRVEDCRRILITHYHADHSGLAGLIAERSGAEVFLSEIEAQTIRAFGDSGERAARLRRYALENGLDGETMDTVERAFSAFRAATTPFLEGGALFGGQRLTLGGRGMEVIATPGHTRGHISFYLPAEGSSWPGTTFFPASPPTSAPTSLIRTFAR